MNHYGLLAHKHWSAIAPNRVRALTNPEEFFTNLGEQVLSHIHELSLTLQGPDPQGQAEKIVLNHFVWIEAEQVQDDARRAWEAARPIDEILLVWALKAQSRPAWDRPSNDELHAIAQAWALTPEFLQGLIEASNPLRFYDSHTEMVQASIEARWQAFQAQSNARVQAQH